MRWSFEHGTVRVKDLRAVEATDPGHGLGGRGEISGDGRNHKVEIRQLEVKGEPIKPTKRFWRSFFMRFGIADNVFRYFEPAEVFDRISQRVADDTVRYCIERDADGNARLLAVSSPNRPLITYAEVHDLVARYGGNHTAYDEGILTSTHTPRGGNQTFQIRGEGFQHRFIMETPVDGFSHPKVYLSFLRLICSNGAVGYSRTFRSDISLGKDIAHCIGRALESYDNDDGYAALRQRFESAQTSWASVRECHDLYRTLVNAHGHKQITKPNVLTDLTAVTGNLHALYGLSNLDALSIKRQRVLPAKCRVYDLINFASEIATHHADFGGRRAMQAYIGNLISDEYDMEGTADTVSEFGDFFANQTPATPSA